jgi:hypothetical protein
LLAAALLHCAVQSLRTASPEQMAAALAEMHITQHIKSSKQQQVLNPAAENTAGDATAGATNQHIVQLLDSFVLQQAPQQQQQQVEAVAPGKESSKQRQKRDRKAVSSAAVASRPQQPAATTKDGSSSSVKPAAVVLVFEPLQQSLAWVLQFIRQR